MRHTRPVTAVVLSVALLVATVAVAHPHLRRSDPRDGSQLTAPASVVLEFSEDSRLTGAWIEKQGGQKQELAPPQNAQSRIAVPLPKLDPGVYVLTWRVQGSDGHVVPGKLRFTVRP